MDEGITIRWSFSCWMDSMEAFSAEEMSIYRKRRSKANIVMSYLFPFSPSEPRSVAFFRIRATGSKVPPHGGLIYLLLGFSDRAVTPGSSLPSSNSRLAPPPVDT